MFSAIPESVQEQIKKVVGLMRERGFCLYATFASTGRVAELSFMHEDLDDVEKYGYEIIVNPDSQQFRLLYSVPGSHNKLESPWYDLSMDEKRFFHIINVFESQVLYVKCWKDLK